MNFRLGGAIALASAILFASNSFAGTATLTDYSGGNSHFTTNGVAVGVGTGGPFTATTAGVGPLGVQSFLTFCLELNEYINYSTPYNYALSDKAELGGLGGGSPDQLSDATKWLYYQARTGGYVGVFAGLSLSTASAGALIQLAVWHLENELVATGDALALANAAISNAGAWTGIKASGVNVYAMNLLEGTTNKQSMLAMTVPDGGTTLGLLGLSMAGLAIASRRFRRA